MQVLFDSGGVLRTYSSAEQILDDFVETRRSLYLKRKKFLVGMLGAEALKLSNQARFIMMKIRNEIVMENKKKKYIVDKLVEAKFEADPVKQWKVQQRKAALNEQHDVVESDDDDDDHTNENDGQDGAWVTVSVCTVCPTL